MLKFVNLRSQIATSKAALIGGWGSWIPDQSLPRTRYGVGNDIKNYVSFAMARERRDLSRAALFA